MSWVHHKFLGWLMCIGWSGAMAMAAARPFEVLVECEEDVYTYEQANNGAGPMWCHGSTCLVRYGNEVFASGLETLPNAKPLNNCRWLLFHRTSGGWEKLLADPAGRTREPCPLGITAQGQLWLSANPTLVADPQAYAGPAQPVLLRFSARQPQAPYQPLAPEWKGSPRFTEHSYRSLAVDGRKGTLILLQNIDYTHAEWAYRDNEGRWLAGQLQWPWGADYAKPQPIRVCYPNVALDHRTAHFCGVSDITEPNPAWREYKKQLTGREWDYDFRRLYYTWSPDLRSGRFQPWIEVASRESTAGWITPGDMVVDRKGTAHLLWSERAIDERLRAKFFPEARQSHALHYAQIKEGRIVLRRTLVQAEEGGPQEIPGRGRFHATAEDRLFVIFYVSGADAAGQRISENRVLELRDGNIQGSIRRVPLSHPMADFYTATPRAGSKPSLVLDLLGQRAGGGTTISYARVRFALHPEK
jgi:hypothetical protein